VRWYCSEGWCALLDIFCALLQRPRRKSIKKHLHRPPSSIAKTNPALHQPPEKTNHAPPNQHPPHLLPRPRPRPPPTLSMPIPDSSTVDDIAHLPAPLAATRVTLTTTSNKHLPLCSDALPSSFSIAANRLPFALIGAAGGGDFPRRCAFCWWCFVYKKKEKGGRGRCLGGEGLVDVESGGAQMLNFRPMMRKKIKPRAMPIIWRIMTLARRRMRRVIFRMIVVLMLGMLMPGGVVMRVESRCEEVLARGLWCVFGVG